MPAAAAVPAAVVVAGDKGVHSLDFALVEGAVVVEHSLVVCASEALAVLHWERLRKPDMMTGSHAAAKTAILFQP